MTVLEEYKLSIDILVKELREGRTDICFCERVADKLEEMMQIIINTGSANYEMAYNLRIMKNIEEEYSPDCYWKMKNSIGDSYCMLGCGCICDTSCNDFEPN